MAQPQATSSLSASDPSTSTGTNTIRLPRPIDDFHLHLRDGEVLIDIMRPMLGHNAIRRAIVMPNLQPPVTNAKMASEYRERILSAVGQVQKQKKEQGITDKIEFTPLMTLYLTDQTTVEEIKEATETGFIYACKLYPKGATTHSNQGVTDILALVPVLKVMAEVGLLLLIHGESTDPTVDIFDRESSFLPVLQKILVSVPTLRVVLEHVTTEAAVEFVKANASSGRLAATITAHHLLYARNALFEGGLQPHLYCLPVLKTERDRAALLNAVLDDSSRPFFFAGTDSAPHPRSRKERSGCAAGCFTAFATIELYTEAIITAGRNAKLQAGHVNRILEEFLTINGAKFYGLERNPSRVVELIERDWTVPDTMLFGSETLVPIRAGQQIRWMIK